MELQYLDLYREDGFVKIPKVFTEEEIGFFKKEANRLLEAKELIHEYNLRTNFLKTNKGIWYLEKIDPIIDISKIYFDLAYDNRLMNIASAILNQEPYLFRDKLIIKPSGMQGYPLHQDYSWWHHLPPNDICTIAVAIDNCNMQNGAITFYKGCHKEIILPKGEYRNFSAEETNAISEHEYETVLMQAGDVIAFHSLCPHYSYPNLSLNSRMIFYPGYVSSSVGDIYDSYIVHQRNSKLSTLEESSRELYYFK